MVSVILGHLSFRYDKENYNKQVINPSIFYHLVPKQGSGGGGCQLPIPADFGGRKGTFWTAFHSVKRYILYLICIYVRKTTFGALYHWWFLSQLMFLWHKSLVLVGFSLLPEGAVSRNLCPGWKGSTTISPSRLRILEANKSWNDGRFQLVIFSTEQIICCSLPLSFSSYLLLLY